MDEQAKSMVFALAQSVDSRPKHEEWALRSSDGVCEQLGESLGLGEEDLRELRLLLAFTT